MEQHETTYEQYCWVMRRNIVLEETTFHNGTRKVSCMQAHLCRENGGCRNVNLLPLFRGARKSIDEAQ